MLIFGIDQVTKHYVQFAFLFVHTVVQASNKEGRWYFIWFYGVGITFQI